VAAEWDGTGRRLLIRGAETVDAFTVTGEAGSPLGFGAAAVTGYGRIVLGLAYTELLLTVADENGGTVAQGFLAGPEGQVAFPNGLRLQLALNAAMIDSLPIGAAVGQTALLTVVNAPSGVGGPNLTTQRTASEALAILDRALASVTEQRSALGAVQNRLEHTAANLAVASQNMTAARSRIEDADMAAEVARLARAAVVQDAAFRMTAQGRVRAQMVLRLLRPGDPPR
jgi:flagellin